MKAQHIYGIILATACVLMVVFLHSSAQIQGVGSPAVGGFRTSPMVRSLQRSTRVYRRKEFHPEFHEQVPVFCNGEEVYKISGTADKYVVDIWSGNHPFYQDGGGMIVKADRIDKFKNRFEGMDEMFGGELSAEDGQAGLLLKKKAMEQLGIKKDKGKKGRR
ncbi:hypothetical protein AAMO2058_000008900 [Amorphochlora amoebiformis]